MSPNASYPAIGIRPLIDGRRRGVRESLEEKTIQLAQDVAELISTNLTYPDGTPVRCVIAKTAIGGPELGLNHLDQSFLLMAVRAWGRFLQDHVAQPRRP